MFSHSLEQGVLVLTVHGECGLSGRAPLLTRIGDLVHAYKPAPVVVVLEEAASVSTVVSVLQVHRMCSQLGILMSVASHSAPVRRLLEANADTSGVRMVIHARADTAIAAAFTAVA
ncbi:hypothetical protein [Streptomyces sp. NPDC057363]|uniref:hypothetical protein n=1 Tax=Streptomyces sp. NPDC057363 TaxID=3346107 RepID=UPI003642FAAF